MNRLERLSQKPAVARQTLGILSIFTQYINVMRRSQSGKSTVRLVHVDTTQLDLDHEFELSRDDGNSGETIYKVKPSEQPSQNTEVILVQKNLR